MTVAAAGRLDALLAERSESNRTFFVAEAENVARCCHRMAERFARGGRLVAFGRSPGARSDVRHVAVEFVHPVIVGKRALPAIGLAAEGGPLAAQVGLIAEPDDIAIAFGTEEPGEPAAEACAALATARQLGCMTIAFSSGSGAEWEFEPPTSDPFIRQELVETLYHVLWELVHVFFDHQGLLEGRDVRQSHDPGHSSFLYPFLAGSETGLEEVVEDVRSNTLMKSEEVGVLREQTLSENREPLLSAAAALSQCFDSGGKALVFGNGGSATDSMDLVADLHAAPQGWTPRPALDLTEDPSIITAIANDVGVEAIFLRQIIAYGKEGDIAIAISTSGNSTNIIAALAEARKRQMGTVALVGYDGGKVASEGLADHVIVTRSQHIPRIQEAQASAYHALRELVEIAEG